MKFRSYDGGPQAIINNGNFSAMAAILRDRINDLLTANADLEREVARLRYADAGKKSKIKSNACW